MDFLGTVECRIILNKYIGELLEIGVSVQLGENWEALASIFYTEGIKLGKKKGEEE